MKQGGTFKVTIPVEITYDWYPEEPESVFEPKVEEYFSIVSMKIGDLDMIDYLDCYRQTDVEVDMMSMLKKQALEELS